MVLNQPITPPSQLNTLSWIMPARIIDGVQLAATYRGPKSGPESRPCADPSGQVRLDAVLVESGDGNAPASTPSATSTLTCNQLGIDYKLHRFAQKALGYDDIAGRVLLLSSQDDVSAIMMHLPLPEGGRPPPHPAPDRSGQGRRGRQSGEHRQHRLRPLFPRPLHRAGRHQNA